MAIIFNGKPCGIFHSCLRLVADSTTPHKLESLRSGRPDANGVAGRREPQGRDRSPNRSPSLGSFAVAYVWHAIRHNLAPATTAVASIARRIGLPATELCRDAQSRCVDEFVCISALSPFSPRIFVLYDLILKQDVTTDVHCRTLGRHRLGSGKVMAHVRVRGMSRRILRGFSPASLEAARKAKKLTRGELGRLAEVSPAAVLSWEVGKASPQVDYLARVVNVLGITMDDVVLIPRNERYLGDLRVFRGLTQPQLAKKIGMSTTALATVERGHSRLREDVAEKLSQGLDATVDEVKAAYERTRTRPPHTSP